MAPSNFGAYSGDLLVGNFGNGRISAYQLRSTDNKWVYKGQVRVASGAPIAIDGLWAIAFGNGASAGPTNNLYFAAGRAAARTACSASSPRVAGPGSKREGPSGGGPSRGCGRATATASAPTAARPRAEKRTAFG